ncbi:MAG: 4-hydroxy-tetrahydrodipicolinate reductase [Verrucomicrobiales bacterium]|nr:4-hydroxy-tetrahydrodipicolinate reductase [Verrucomicrobiales bacterium]
MTRIILTGAKGRMGTAVRTCIRSYSDLELVAEIDLGDDLAAHITRGDVVVDFSVHTATVPILECCAAHGKPAVVGTTGHSEAERKRIKELTQRIPVVLAPNFSAGVNALFWLVRKAAEILGPDFDLEIVEMHHRLKKDAPSGTAKALAEILAETRGLNLEAAARHGRVGIVGERPKAEIGIHAVRGGDIVGTHTVIFAGNGERLELTHHATSRDTFAHGALRAARWVIGKSPGLYDMRDVLGLRSA